MSEVISFLSTPEYQQGMSLVGSATSAIGKYYAGKSASEIAEYNAQIATKKAAIKERQIREAGKKLSSRQRALYAKAGVDLASGSPLSVLADTAADIEEQALMERLTGKMESDRLLASGEVAEKQGLLAASTSFLTDLSKIGFEYTKRKPRGSVNFMNLSPGLSDW